MMRGFSVPISIAVTLVQYTMGRTYNKQFGDACCEQNTDR